MRLPSIVAWYARGSHVGGIDIVCSMGLSDVQTSQRNGNKKTAAPANNSAYTIKRVMEVRGFTVGVRILALAESAEAQREPVPTP